MKRHKFYPKKDVPNNIFEDIFFYTTTSVSVKGN